MKHISSWRLRRALPVLAVVASGVLIAASPSIVKAQTPGPADATHAQATSQDPQLAKQIDELRAQVARLQAALDQQRQSAPQPSTPAPPQQPSSGMRMGEMGQRMGMGEMGSMPPGGGMGMMNMDKGEMGMPPEGMRMGGEMGGMASPSGAAAPTTGGGMQMGSGSGAGGTSTSGGMPMGGSTTGGGMRMGGPAARPGRSTSALPGVPGASHLYHIGSTGFFLDQPQITLTSEQQASLNRLKERALLERTTADRTIEQTEQELWALTGADQPDATKVQAKLKDIEQLRTNQRMAFIRAVGEAANVLTAEQRNVVLGTGMPKK